MSVMAVLEHSPTDRARKSATLALQRLSPDGTQRNIAQSWGVSESTVSRLKENIEPISKLCAQLGIKWVPVEMKCYPPEQLEALLTLAKASLARAKSVDDVLSWEDE